MLYHHPPRLYTFFWIPGSVIPSISAFQLHALCHHLRKIPPVSSSRLATDQRPFDDSLQTLLTDARMLHPSKLPEPQAMWPNLRSQWFIFECNCVWFPGSVLPLSFYVSIPEFFPGQRTAPRFVACEVILVGRDRCKDKIELWVCRAHCHREDNDHLLQVVRPERLALCFKAACLQLH